MASRTRFRATRFAGVDFGAASMFAVWRFIALRGEARDSTAGRQPTRRWNFGRAAQRYRTGGFVLQCTKRLERF